MRVSVIEIPIDIAIKRYGATPWAKIRRNGQQRSSLTSAGGIIDEIAEPLLEKPPDSALSQRVAEIMRAYKNHDLSSGHAEVGNADALPLSGSKNGH